MGEFGDQLRRERESRGITLESIRDATKVSSRYLVALETGHFNILPGGVFNKGIVRSYAKSVGLDEEDWVNRFMSAYRQSGHLTDDDANWIEFAENVGKSRVPVAKRGGVSSNAKWAGFTLLLVLLVTLGWFVWHFVGNKTAAQMVTAHPVVVSACIHDAGRSILRPV
jgi:cytoskeleton protein RodZ